MAFLGLTGGMAAQAAVAASSGATTTIQSGDDVVATTSVPDDGWSWSAVPGTTTAGQAPTTSSHAS